MAIPQFGSLEDAKAAATASGYEIVYDGRFQNIPSNATGAVSLNKWPGIRGPKGEAYEYAFDDTHISARPALPTNHGLNLHTKDNKELIQLLARVIEVRKAIGPEKSFLLGGNEKALGMIDQ